MGECREIELIYWFSGSCNLGQGNFTCLETENFHLLVNTLLIEWFVLESKGHIFIGQDQIVGEGVHFMFLKYFLLWYVF